MSRRLERLAATCLLPSFPGVDVPDWIRRFLERGGASVLFFAYNVPTRGDLAALTGALRAEREDVLLAIDEEGGDVTRLEWREGSSYPSAAGLGAVADVALTGEVAAAIGADLAGVGINWNFAPVADVNVPANPVIGVRCFRRRRGRGGTGTLRPSFAAFSARVSLRAPSTSRGTARPSSTPTSSCLSSPAILRRRSGRSARRSRRASGRS